MADAESVSMALLRLNNGGISFRFLLSHLEKIIFGNSNLDGVKILLHKLLLNIKAEEKIFLF